jgi:lysophospholipase L1-like esterase
MNRLNKIIVLILTLIFSLSATISSRAETYSSNNYTSLGDSIAYGMSASQGKGYVDLFYNYLKRQDGNSGMNIYNFAVPGDTSSELLWKLQNDTNIQNSVKKAKVVTISIGGYNILSPVLAAACKALQVDLWSSTLLKDLGDKINAASDKAAIIEGLMDSPTLQSAIVSGVMKFGTDWTRIVAAIKALSPNAKVYAMTIYNPISVSDPIHNIFEPIVKLMNGTIRASASRGEYKVVDVYSAFKEYKEKDPLVNFGLSSGNADPHPTNKGHEVIFRVYTTVATPKPNTAPIPVKSKDTTITSSKYKIDKIKSTIAIGNLKISLNTFKSNIKVAKGATYTILKTDGKTAIVSGKVVRGMIVKVKAEDRKTYKLYKIILNKCMSHLY